MEGKRNNMKYKGVLVVGFLILIGCPLVIALGTSADILNWAINDNDWIGFWGGYIGTLIGGGITLFVLFRSLADSKKTLNETLANERHIQERNEVIMFSNLLIEKSALYSVEIDELIHQINYYLLEKNKDAKIERMMNCLKEYRLVRSILVEISMHLEIVENKEAYCSDMWLKLYETVEELLELVNKYKNEFLKSGICNNVEKKIYELSNSLIFQTQDYLKQIM